MNVPSRLIRSKFLPLSSLALLLILFCSANPLRADVVSDFDQAGKFYEQGKYAEAVNLYDHLLHAGKVSEALYFNRGNAFLKMGQLGKAIASYRQAEQLAPRDAELRANLQFARTQARGGSPARVNYWRRWLEIMTLNEWTVLTAAALWLLFVLLALTQWRPELKPSLKSLLATVALALIFFGVCLAGSLNQNYFTRSAIVVTGEAEVRNGPLDESQSAYKVRDGVELGILDTKDGWFRVVDPAGRSGWLRQEQVLVLDPGTTSKKNG
jgi:tetratricopeptide (TPR) repeat protein